MEESTNVNYVPVRVNDLDEVSRLLDTDSVLLARNQTNEMGYSTKKITYDELSNQLYWDVYRSLSGAGLSVYVDEEHLYFPPDYLNETWAFGSRVIQTINNRLETVISTYVSTDFDQEVSGTKTFVIAPKTTLSTISSDQSVTNVEYLSKKIRDAENTFAFSNDSVKDPSATWGNPATTSTNLRPLHHTSPYYVYTVQNDCMLFIKVTSKQGSGGMRILIGQDKLNTNGVEIHQFPDNDTEMWWLQTIRIPVLKGTYLKFIPSTEKWWLREISEIRYYRNEQ